MTILADLVFILFYLVGLVGIVVPVLPGVPIIAVGALLAGWMTGFEMFTWSIVLWISALAVLAQLIDYIAGVIGAKRYGASRPGVWGSILGSLVGLFFFPPLGFLLGALVGAVAFELLSGRNFQASVRSGVGALLGTLGGIFAKIFIVIAIGIIAFPAFF